ncbi:hypothetical protein JCM10213_001109 [Rhodosporidiobolus nylandii]
MDFRPRTVSASLRGLTGDDASGSHAWSDWGSTGYSPDRPMQQPQQYADYGELLGESSFAGFDGARQPQQAYQPGLGFELPMPMNGIEEEPAEQLHGQMGFEGAMSTAAGDGTVNSQPFPLSHAQSIAPPNLQMSALASPASPFFPGGLPSPFHDRPSSFAPSPSAGTINPTHSVRSSSPSDSSVSNVGPAGSTTSSIYGGETSTAPSTPYRSNSISSRGGASERSGHQKHLRRRSSPIKGQRHSRKLSNADRKAICQFHLAHPGLKQDDIGAHFGYERSTISKTLKYKEKYLAMGSDDESSATAIIQAAENERRAQYAASSSTGPSPEASGQFTDFAAGGQQQLASSSSVSSLASLDSSGFGGDPGASSASRTIIGGRFPQIDNALADWAREQVSLGHALSDAALQRQARSVARNLGSDNFKASQTWLDGFKLRSGIANGTFRDLVPLGSPPAPIPTPTPQSQRWLPPPKEEDGEEEDDDLVAAAQDEEDEDYDLPASTRRSKRRHGTKTVRRLATSAKSTLSSFADGLVNRAGTPLGQRISTEDIGAGGFSGGSFGDLSMDADATPTHTTVHSRASTNATERPNGLAQPFSYSPTAMSDTGSIVTPLTGEANGNLTPSRLGQHAPSPLTLGSNAEYSPPGPLSNGYGYTPSGLGNSHGSAQDLADYGANLNGGPSASSSHSSLANYAGMNNGTTVGPSCFDPSNSPAPVYHHGRSGSTASINSVYSGLTAFSTHSQGPGTPLTGSIYGSFRGSQNDLCSVPGTPANGLSGAASTGFFNPQEQQHSFPSSQYPQQLPQPPQHSQHSSHQRYPPSASQGYPGTPNHPHSLHSSQQQPGSGGRRATISGGAPFPGRTSSVMSPHPTSSLSRSTQQQPSPVTLDQAFSSLEIALDFLATRAGQDLQVGPKDLVVLSDLKAKMERARSAQGVNLAAISSAPPTPSSASALGPSPFFQQQMAAFQPHAQQPQPQHAPQAATIAQKQSQRLRLARTQSTSAVPSFGAMGQQLGSAGSLERGMLTRRSGSSLSLFEVEGH